MKRFLIMFRNYWGAYRPHLPPGWAAAAVLLGLAVFVLLEWNRRKKEKRIIGFKGISASLGAGFGAGYAVAVFVMLVIGRKAGTRRSELMPFWSYQRILEGSRDLIFENIFNVLLFIPFGAAMMLWSMEKGSRRSAFLKTTLAGAVFSIVIEVLQYWTARGLAEFDDVFHNTLGAAAGAGIVLLMCRVMILNFLRISD